MQKEYPYFFVVDLDRTILNTDVFVVAVMNALEKQGVPTEELEATKEFTRVNEGSSFDLIDYIEAVYGDKIDITNLEDEVIATTGIETGSGEEQPLLYEGARELLTTLSTSGMPSMILTKGGQRSQTLKMRSLGAQVDPDLVPPHLITDTNQKMDYLTRTLKSNAKGQWIIDQSMSSLAEPIAVDTIVALDDKIENLLTFTTQGIKVFLINNTGKGEGISIEEATKQVQALIA